MNIEKAEIKEGEYGDNNNIADIHTHIYIIIQGTRNRPIIILDYQPPKKKGNKWGQQITLNITVRSKAIITLYYTISNGVKQKRKRLEVRGSEAHHEEESDIKLLLLLLSRIVIFFIHRALSIST